ncbi:MAG: putative lipid II flippase FtsW [Clostridia bacterium]|nr:putative lipid II flippase FtsW [Clostridia bacterium]
MNKKAFLKEKFNLNLYVLIPTICLIILGIVMIYSASSYTALKNYGSSMFFASKQIIGAVVGLFAMMFFYFFDYNRLSKTKYIALAISLIVLAVVFIPGVGIENYGAKRWIGFGSFSFQASEIAKFCFIVFCAGYMAKHKDKICTFKGILPILVSGLCVCALIMLEPNMSITLCVAGTLLIMLLIGGINIKHLCFLLIPAVLLVPLLIIIEPYRLKRIVAFLDPWQSPQGEGFQLIQSLYSLGSGGFFGVGLFNSRAKYSFLPFSESDFIFSIIGEELGLCGAIFVLVVFAILIFAGFKIAQKSTTRFGCYLATGISSLIAIQVVLNVAVCSGLVPPTGLPLPFMSAGSTSLVMFMSAIGVLLNISKQNKNKFINYEQYTKKLKSKA